uniref:Uncharacterized protein n=1 Tax=Chromera velia CCMP2878 TaxID=1169474 RepID=A0A0G4G0X6_9ALVE|eukprot:Cvel_517.t1-p1 / transcript=Cvel_517.t1 / gene=Cvel_517 / organism=Chromera_velia_CCMP2878 / gene_product=hypothetical protein / transcript_product=hypothetical protein / location=Cvel_scaffold16:72858-75021(-) / protein_length=286 / sequence_SO=supercontig / SO=protein_coding / is_pseudo=false
MEQLQYNNHPRVLDFQDTIHAANCPFVPVEEKAHLNFSSSPLSHTKWHLSSESVSGDKDTEELLEALNQDPCLEVLQGNEEDWLIDLSIDDSDAEGDTLVVMDITDSLDSHYKSANKLEEFVDKFLKVGSVAKTREEAVDNIFALMKEDGEALGFKYEGSYKGEGASKSFNQLWFGGTLSSLEIAKEGGSVHPTLDLNCFCRGSVVQILDQGQPLWVVLWGYRRGVRGGSNYKGAKLVMHNKKNPFQGEGGEGEGEERARKERGRKNTLNEKSRKETDERKYKCTQ